MIIILGGNTITSIAAEQPLMDKIICIDPGHGGRDQGAVNGYFDLYVSFINLDVSYGLKFVRESKPTRYDKFKNK